MRKHVKFRHEFLVGFEMDEFMYRGRPHVIMGLAGVDVDQNKVQLRDDLFITFKGGKYPYRFEKVMAMWDEIMPELIRIVKSKPLRRRTRYCE